MGLELVYLTYLGVIFLLGLLCSAISQKLRVPNVLLLLLTGILINNISYNGAQLIEFPSLFNVSISTLALIMIVFDGCSRFKLKDFDDMSLRAIKLTIFSLIVSVFVMTFLTHFIFAPSSIFLSLIFAVVVIGTAPDAVISMIKDTGKPHSSVEFLEAESIINTPFMVLLPFIIIDLMKTVKANIIISTFIQQITPFLQQIITGIGAGMLIGLLIFKVMRNQYSETLSPLALIAAALLSYILAENLGGNGVLSVTTAGLFFGNIYIKQKSHLQQFSYFFANFLEILVFVLVGLAIKIPFTKEFFIKAIVLFVFFLIMRYFVVLYTFRDTSYSAKSKIFIGLNAPKGIATATLAFLLSTLNIAGMEVILDIILVFLLFSIISSTVMFKLSRYFLGKEVVA